MEYFGAGRRFGAVHFAITDNPLAFILFFKFGFLKVVFYLN